MRSVDWVPFQVLMDSPEVRDLADRQFANAREPDWMERFQALTMLCTPCLPEYDLVSSGVMASEGLTTFYAHSLAGLTGDLLPDEQYHTVVPWTLRVGLGASAWFTFERTGELTSLINEDDSGDGSEWMDRTKNLLSQSYWRPINLGMVDAMLGREEDMSREDLG